MPSQYDYIPEIPEIEAEITRRNPRMREVFAEKKLQKFKAKQRRTAGEAEFYRAATDEELALDAVKAFDEKDPEYSMKVKADFKRRKEIRDRKAIEAEQKSEGMLRALKEGGEEIKTRSSDTAASGKEWEKILRGEQKPPLKQPVSRAAKVMRAMAAPGRWSTGIVAGALREAKGAPTKESTTQPFTNLEPEPGTPEYEKLPAMTRFRRSIGRIVTSGKQAFSPETFEQAAPLQTYFEEAQKEYSTAATKEALDSARAWKNTQSAPPSPVEIREKFFEENARIYKDKLSRDLGAVMVEHPNAAQFISEVFLDPLNAAPLLPAAKFVKKIPGVSAVAEKIVALGRKATKAVRFGSIYDDLLKAGERGTTFVKELKYNYIQSYATRKAAHRAMESTIAVLGKVHKDDEGLLWLLANGKLEYEAALKAAKQPEALKTAYEAHHSLEIVHQGLREVTGVGQKFSSEGTLESAAALKLEQYAPHRLLTPEYAATIAGENVTKGVRRKFARLLPGSTLERKGAPLEAFVPNLKEQWIEEMSLLAPKSFTRQAQKATEIKGIRESGIGLGFIKEYHPPNVKSQEALAAQLPKLKQRLFEKHGVEFTELNQELNEVYTRITGTPGFKRGTQITMVPVPVAERLKQLLPIVGYKDPEAVGGYLRGLNTYLARPILRNFRFWSTVPNPLFWTKNLGGALSLGYLASGTKAYKGAPGAAALTLIGAKWLPKGAREKALNAAWTLPASGKKFPLRNILKAAETDGIINQFEFRAALDGAGKADFVNPLGLIADASEALGHVGGRASLQNIATASDNFQHLLVYMNVLKDPASHVARREAWELTRKFAGDYRAMTQTERFFLREAAPFYAWNRFIVPLTIKSLVENPVRMANFEKVRAAFEREWGQYAPVKKAGTPVRGEASSFTAPLAAQPKTIRQVLKQWAGGSLKNLPEPGSEQFVRMQMETPAAMGLYFLDALEKTAGIKYDMDDSLSNQLGPLVMFVLDWHDKDLAEAGKDFLKTMTPRPARALVGSVDDWRQSRFGGIAQMFKEAGNLDVFLETRLRLAATRALGLAWIPFDEQKGMPIPAIGISPEAYQPEAVRTKRKQERVEKLYERSYELR